MRTINSDVNRDLNTNAVCNVIINLIVYVFGGQNSEVIVNVHARLSPSLRPLLSLPLNPHQILVCLYTTFSALSLILIPIYYESKSPHI